MLKFFRSLNWFGFWVVLLISMAGACSNENVSSFLDWLFLVLIIGVPSACFFLFMGRQE
jgi:hypothetical protein